MGELLRFPETPHIQPGGPCANCGGPIAPNTIYFRQKGKPVHCGPCPQPGPFAAARMTFSYQATA
jgi:hypothetical protein